MAERQAHVLVVDDDEALLGLYRELLGDEGYRVTALTDAPADPALVHDLAPDVLLLNLRLGTSFGGPSLLDRLAADPATAAIPVVLCTGDVREIEALRGRAGGLSSAVVFKPFDLDDLLAAVAAALRPKVTA